MACQSVCNNYMTRKHEMEQLCVSKHEIHECTGDSLCEKILISWNSNDPQVSMICTMFKNQKPCPATSTLSLMPSATPEIMFNDSDSKSSDESSVADDERHSH